MEIQRQVNVLTRDGRNVFQQADNTPVIIHLDLLITGFTMKIVFVVTLNPLFTDVMVRRVILCQPFFIQRFKVVIVYL